jgi:anti-sigma B factor antagonist
LGGTGLMTPGVDVDVLVTGDRAIVALNGDIDISTAAEVRERLVGLVARGVRHLLVDLEHTLYIDAMGVDVLLRAFKLLSAHGGTFAMACPHDHLAKVFHVSALSSALAIYPSLQEASVHFSQG